ncbi:hypothetical protein YB2330_006395 [Saitoella coloradoensis]
MAGPTPTPNIPKGKPNIGLPIAVLAALGIGIGYAVFKEDKHLIKEEEAHGGPKGGVKL